MGKKLKSLYSFGMALYKRCSEHRISRSAAELTYYILFTLFPLVIFIYSVISMLDLPIDEMLSRMLPILPAEIYELILEYLTYVGGMSRTFMLYAGSVLAVYMLFKAITSLNYAVRRAMGGETMRSRTRIIMSLLTSCIIMLLLLLFLILFSITRNIYHYIALFFELGGWVKLLADIIRYAAGPAFLFFTLTAYYYARCGICRFDVVFFLSCIYDVCQFLRQIYQSLRLSCVYYGAYDMASHHLQRIYNRRRDQCTVKRAKMTGYYYCELPKIFCTNYDRAKIGGKDEKKIVSFDMRYSCRLRLFRGLYGES